jgi:hypothetical protein
MEADLFDEPELFSTIAASGARALLIGRRALIAIGMPVLTADYDYWIHLDDIAAFNDALAPLGLVPTLSPEDARKRGRYRLENHEIVDVLLGRQIPMTTGGTLVFDEVWSRRSPVEVAPGVDAQIPCLEDLVGTKRFGARPKDLEDLRFLAVLIGTKEKG